MFVLSFFIVALSAAAQTGEISGTVVEKSTGDPMMGVNVFIPSINTGTTTDLDGHYSIKAPAGTYTVRFSFVSFATVELSDVKVEAGIASTANVAMQESSTGIGEVTVYAVRKMNSEVSLINTMRSSSLVISGISSQQITRNQDRDASEVIKRIPGISIIDNRFVIARGLAQRYNNVWINNNAVPSSEADTRAFSFDMIPSGQIENIMIVKSPAPELPADFSGGFVTIATKSMPDENVIQASYGVNVNTATHFSDFKYAKGSGTDFIGYDNGFRSMKSVVPERRVDNTDAGLVTNVTRNGFNNDWSVRNMRPIADHRFSFMINRNHRMTKGQLGLVAALNYSLSYLTYTDMTNARFGIYNKTEDKPEYYYKYSDDQYTQTARTGGMLNLIWAISPSHRLELRNIFNIQGRDRYTFRDGWQNISARYSQEKEEYYYTSRGAYTGQIAGSHNMEENGKIDWTAGYSYADKQQPDRRIIDREEDRDKFSVNSIIRDFNKLGEDMYSAGINYNRPFSFGNFTPSIKAGLYADYRARQYDTRYFLYKMKVDNLPSDFFYRNITEMMLPEYLSADKLFISDATDRTNDYAGTNLLTSGYLGVNLPAGKLNVYAGLRYEDNRMSLTNHTTINTDATEVYNYNSADLFPSVNITYNLNKTNLLRFAYGKSVNRQEFREVSPSTYYDFELFSFVRGNKDLRQAYIDNFDLRYEIYPSGGELISLALFYKRFINPIEWTYIDAGGSYTFTFENARQANNYGVELDMKKSLDIIGMPDLSLAFNGALISSHVIFDKESMEHDRPMQGQSPFLVNAGLFYARKSINAGLMYNVIGKRITGIGRIDNSHGGTIDNNIPDMYEMPRHVFDLSFSYKIGTKVELGAGIRDLLALPMTYKQFPEYTDASGKIVQREQVTKEYKPGRNFSISIKLTL
jgi:outer membrane receptor for ferrienterochelin and colicin